MRFHRLLLSLVVAGLSFSLAILPSWAEDAGKNEPSRQGGLLPGETRDQKRERLVKSIEAQVGTLTPDQKTHILAVLAAAGDEMAAARENKSLTAEQQDEVVRKVHADIPNRISPALTLAQRAKSSSGRSGGFGMAGGPSDETPEQRRARTLKRYEDALPSLSAIQKQQISSVLESSSNEMKALRENTTLSEDDQRTAIRKVHDAVGAKIDAILTDSQRANWEKARQARRQQAASLEAQMGGLLPNETREQKRSRLLKSYEAVLTDLTVDQKTRILGVIEAAGDEMRAIEGDTTLSETQKKDGFQRAYGGVGAKIDAILTEAQRSLWRKSQKSQLTASSTTRTSAKKTR